MNSNKIDCGVNLAGRTNVSLSFSHMMKLTRDTRNMRENDWNEASRIKLRLTLVVFELRSNIAWFWCFFPVFKSIYHFQWFKYNWNLFLSTKTQLVLSKVCRYLCSHDMLQWGKWKIVFLTVDYLHNNRVSII